MLLDCLNLVNSRHVPLQLEGENHYLIVHFFPYLIIHGRATFCFHDFSV